MNIPKPKEMLPAIEPKKISSGAGARRAVAELREAIRYHDKKYYEENAPVISDADYDRLVETLRSLEERFPRLRNPDSPTQRVAGKPREGFAHVKHPFPMLSLKSAHEEKAVWDFDRSCREAAGHPAEYVAGPKYDGLSVELIYEKGLLVAASTRGDGETGEDVTANIQTLRELPAELRRTRGSPVPPRLVVRGEVFMRKDEFKRLNRQLEPRGEPLFANPRNAAAGSLRQLDPQITARRPLHLFLYEIAEVQGQSFGTHWEALRALAQWGLPVNKQEQELCRDIKQVLGFHERLLRQREHLPYEIDGAVFKLNDRVLQKKLGFRTRDPRWALAYKFPPLQATSVLKTIDVQVGRTGRLTPVAVLEPVSIGGVTVGRASLHNESEIRRKDIHVGDTVQVERAGDVIPYVVKVVTQGHRRAGRKEFHMPRNCPVCGGKVFISEDKKEAHCENADCPAQLLGRVTHFASSEAMDIRGLGEERARQLIDKGLVKNVASIYSLTREQALSLNGFAHKSADNLLRAIEKSKRSTLPRFIYALGIPQVGEHMAHVLAKDFHRLDDLIESARAGPEELARVPGVGPEAARSIATFFSARENREIVQKMQRTGLKLANPYRQGGLPLRDLTFVLTGALNRWTRGQAERLVEDLGGHAASSVSGETDYVVEGPGAGAKLETAARRHVQLLDEKAFTRFLEKRGVSV